MIPVASRTYGTIALLLMASIILTAAFEIPQPANAQSQKERLSPRQFSAVVDARNLLEQGQSDKAVAKLLSLTRGEHPPLTLLSHLAWAQNEAGRTDEAIRTYHRAAALYPEDARTARNLGLLLLDREDNAKAAAMLEKAYGLQSGDDKEQVLLALAASARMRIKEFSRALTLLDAAEKDAKTIPLSWTAMAVRCCLRLNRTSLALERARAGTRRHPNMPEAWSLLSRMLTRTGDPLGAASTLETALALRTDPQPDESTRQSVFMELAALYARGHALTEAALRLDEGAVSGSAYQAARLYHLAGKNKAALAALDNTKLSTDDKTRLASLRTSLLRGRILLDLERTDEAVAALLAEAEIRPKQDRRAENDLRGKALLMAGEARWLQRNWSAAAAIFRTLATIPGYADLGTSLTEAMHALIRDSALN